MPKDTNLVVVRAGATYTADVAPHTAQRMYYLIVGDDPKLEVTLNVTSGEESTCEINIAAWLTSGQHLKLHVNTDNRGSYGATVVRTYGILRDEAVAEVTIKSIVRPHTVQNRIDQQINGIVLSPTARMNGQPILVMQSEDVVAKHSLKLGSVDEDEVFYLMSRQMSREDARMILIWSALVRNFKEMQAEIMQEVEKKDANFSKRLQEKLSLIQE